MSLLLHHLVTPHEFFYRVVSSVLNLILHWGGTCVKERSRCPKASTVRAKIWCRVKKQRLAWSRRIWYRDSESTFHRSFWFQEFSEASEKLPEKTGYSRQTFIVTSLSDPEMSSYYFQVEFTKRQFVCTVVGQFSFILLMTHRCDPSQSKRTSDNWFTDSF